MANRRPTQGLLLQQFVVERSVPKRSLYWQAFSNDVTTRLQIDRTPAGELLIGSGTTLSFDTYFNAFFEGPWRRATNLGTLKLRVEAEGPYVLRVFRRALGQRVLIAEHVVSDDVTETSFADESSSFRQHGVLSLEIIARGNPVLWRSAAWFADQELSQSVGLALVFCTFNREADIARVLQVITQNAAVLQHLARIYVVNQGRPSLDANPAIAAAKSQIGPKLQIIEQDNFGGAGGFSRGLLATLDDPEITHAVLLDDDIEIEPDSILRMASFYRLAKADIVIGGQMLDGAQPTRLYEAGAVISERHWAFEPQHHGDDLRNAEIFERLNQPNPVHYNGWWCCAFPLSLIRRVGLPLPCFIRGDDVELGLRLHQQGVPTVSWPGIAVWHEPFYLKLGSWQLYYETRNMLIAAALHQPFERWPVVRRMMRHLLVHLLTFRYYSSALILKGINDFLKGPQILQGPPQTLHASLNQYRERYPAYVTSRGQVVHKQPANRPAPRSRGSFIRLLVTLLLHQLIAPTRAAPIRLLPVEQFTWPMMRGVEHVAVETWWDRDLPTFRRSREDFRSIIGECVRTAWRLFRRGPESAASWRTGFPGLVSVQAWKRYLGITSNLQHRRSCDASSNKSVKKEVIQHSHL